MKVRVQYTIKFDDTELAALKKYHDDKLSRDDLKGLLQDLGVEGVMLQINEGSLSLECESAEDDEK